MTPLDYILQILDNGRLFFIFPLMYVLLLFFNKIIFNKFFNGLIFLTFPTAIAFSIVIDFLIDKKLTPYIIIYFCLSEVLIYFSVLFIYRNIIKKLNGAAILEILKKINNRYFNLIAFILLVEIVVNLINVKWDGSSRIEFQTNQWYSLIRFLSQLINPVAGLLLFYNAYERNYKKLIILTLAVIILFISSGSKSSFVFFLIQYFLVYRDIVYVRTKISLKISAPLISFICLAAIFNFTILNVDYAKVFERLMDYGESTIMVLPSSDPCAACRGQSMISLIHRGVGRLIHDPSSVDVDKLFGYSLAAEFYGENTFTGPNARIGSYALCAFPGFKLLILYIIFIFFITINFGFLIIGKKIGGFIYIVALLLLFDGIAGFILDYNAAMSDLTLVLLIILFLFFRFVFVYGLPRETTNLRS